MKLRYISFLSTEIHETGSGSVSLIKDCVYPRDYIKKVQDLRGSLPVNSLRIIENSIEFVSAEIRFS